MSSSTCCCTQQCCPGCLGSAVHSRCQAQAAQHSATRAKTSCAPGMLHRLQAFHVGSAEHACQLSRPCMWCLCRSASVVIGYLMHERRWRLQEAFKWVCDRRPTVKLSPGEQGCTLGVV